ncbi:MAG TPA: MMPL family transporter [Candidatus Thermoplasmatota archaeon]|nr:MMPL family transporter [Candidatus Thermoplasmatota archaeon]
MPKGTRSNGTATGGPARTRLYGLLLALLCGLAAGALGAYGASAFTGGFQFDWYRHPSSTSLPVQETLSWSVGTAAALALLIAPLGVGFAFRRADRATRVPTSVPGARPRDLHLLRLSLLTGAAAALLAAGFTLALTAWNPVTAKGFVLLLTLTAAFTGAAAFLVPFMITAAALARGRLTRAPPGESLLGSAAAASFRHKGAVVTVVLLLTAGAGYSLTLITTNVDVADVLPRGDPNTDAAHNLTDRFKSSFTQQVTFHVRVAPDRYDAERGRLPHRMTEARPDNISDEVYIRATDQMIEFLKAYVPPGHTKPPFEGAVALPNFYRLVNWTMEGGINAPREAYSLPSAASRADALRYRMVEEGVWRLIPTVADTLISPDFKQTAVLITVSPKDSIGSREIGDAALQAREAYVGWATADPSAYKVFTGENAPLFTVDLPLANAHQSRLTERDGALLLPLIAGFIAVCLWFAFRDARAIFVSFSTLAITLVWTFGAMALLGIPMNPLNLTVIPLLMGIGIDYGIHMMNEIQQGRARGLAEERAIREAGNRVGVSLLVATITSIGGLVVMMLSPSLLVAQLGLLSIIALSAAYLLTITFLPALRGLLQGGSEKAYRYRPSPTMAATARGVSRHRVLVSLLLLGLVGAAYVSSLSVGTEPFGDPPRNWLPDDPLRQEHERAGQGFYATDKPDAKANVLVFEGDILDPAAHRYMDAVEASLKQKPRIINDTLRTVPFLVRTYLAVRDGAPGALQFTLLDRLAGQQPQQVPAEKPYPKSREELKALLEEVHQTPLYEFANLFFDYPETRMGIMTFTARAETYEDAVQVWDQVWAAVEANEHLRPEGFQVAFVGNTATNYLFVAKEVPWLNHMSVAVSLIVVVLVYAVTRDVKATFVVGVHNVVTGLLWLGLLPQLGVGLSIALTLPLIFIFAMGSDYGLHLCLACRSGGDTSRVFERTGKAILYSFITTLGSFVIFTQVSNLAIQRTMIATSAAIVVIFLATVLLIPLFYPAKKAPPPAEGSRSVPVQQPEVMVHVRR